MEQNNRNSGVGEAEVVPEHHPLDATSPGFFVEFPEQEPAKWSGAASVKSDTLGGKLSGCLGIIVLGAFVVADTSKVLCEGISITGGINGAAVQFTACLVAVPVFAVWAVFAMGWEKARAGLFSGSNFMAVMWPAVFFAMSGLFNVIQRPLLGSSLRKVFQQTRIPVTALLSRMVLGRRYSAMQWYLMVVVTLTLPLFRAVQDASGRWRDGPDVLPGLAFSLMGNVTQCLGGLLMERAMKNRASPHFALQQFYLSVWQVVCNVGVMLFLAPVCSLLADAIQGNTDTLPTFNSNWMFNYKQVSHYHRPAHAMLPWGAAPSAWEQAREACRTGDEVCTKPHFLHGVEFPNKLDTLKWERYETETSHVTLPGGDKLRGDDAEALEQAAKLLQGMLADRNKAAFVDEGDRTDFTGSRLALGSYQSWAASTESDMMKLVQKHRSFVTRHPYRASTQYVSGNTLRQSFVFTFGRTLADETLGGEPAFFSELLYQRPSPRVVHSMVLSQDKDRVADPALYGDGTSHFASDQETLFRLRSKLWPAATSVTATYEDKEKAKEEREELIKFLANSDQNAADPDGQIILGDGEAFGQWGMLPGGDRWVEFPDVGATAPADLEKRQNHLPVGEDIYSVTRQAFYVPEGNEDLDIAPGGGRLAIVYALQRKMKFSAYRRVLVEKTTGAHADVHVKTREKQGLFADPADYAWDYAEKPTTFECTFGHYEKFVVECNKESALEDNGEGGRHPVDAAELRYLYNDSLFARKYPDCRLRPVDVGASPQLLLRNGMCQAEKSSSKKFRERQRIEDDEADPTRAVARSFEKQVAMMPSEWQRTSAQKHEDIAVTTVRWLSGGRADAVNRRSRSKLEKKFFDQNVRKFTIAGRRNSRYSEEAVNQNGVEWQPSYRTFTPTGPIAYEVHTYPGKEAAGASKGNDGFFCDRNMCDMGSDGKLWENNFGHHSRALDHRPRAAHAHPEWPFSQAELYGFTLWPMPWAAWSFALVLAILANVAQGALSTYVGKVLSTMWKTVGQCIALACIIVLEKMFFYQWDDARVTATPVVAGGSKWEEVLMGIGLILMGLWTFAQAPKLCTDHVHGEQMERDREFRRANEAAGYGSQVRASVILASPPLDPLSRQPFLVNGRSTFGGDDP